MILSDVRPALRHSYTHTHTHSKTHTHTQVLHLLEAGRGGQVSAGAKQSAAAELCSEYTCALCQSLVLDARSACPDECLFCFLCLQVCLSMCRSIGLSLCLCVCLSLQVLSLPLSLSLYIYIYIYIYVYIYMCICIYSLNIFYIFPLVCF